MEKTIKERLGDGYEVKKISVTKNNGVVQNGFCITRAGSKVGATIYVDGIPEEEIVDRVVNQFKGIEIPEIDVHVVDKDYILSHVYPTMVNKERNEERLKKLVHRSFADLEIIYRVNVNETGSYAIDDKILEYSQITPDELHEASVNNMMSLCVSFSLPEMLGLSDTHPEAPLIILTYKYRVHGSGTILNEELLNSLSKKFDDDLFIIPSSVDEILVLPMSNADVDALNDTIKSVNKNEVPDEAILSDHVYVFRNGKVEVA